MPKCPVCNAILPPGHEYCPPATSSENPNCHERFDIHFAGCQSLALYHYGPQPEIRIKEALPVGHECRPRPSKRLKNRTCGECGKDFIRPLKITGRLKYCCEVCLLTSKNRRQRESRAAKRPLVRICAGCGKAFLRRRNSKYCSPKCKAASILANRLTAKGPSVIDIKCGVCQCVFTWRRQRGTKPKYCSHACRKVLHQRLYGAAVA